MTNDPEKPLLGPKDFPKRVLHLVGLGRWGSNPLSCKVTWLQSVNHTFCGSFCLWQIGSSSQNWVPHWQLHLKFLCILHLKHRWVNSGFQLPNSCFLVLWLWCKQHFHTSSSPTLTCSRQLDFRKKRLPQVLSSINCDNANAGHQISGFFVFQPCFFWAQHPKFFFPERA